MLRRTTKSAACLLAGAALVAGCSAEPEDAPPLSPPAPATTAAPPSALPTPTASPTWPPAIALPTPPPEMARDDEVGAVAAATYFLTELYPYTVSSQDTVSWVAMSHPDCKFCASAVTTAASSRQTNRVAVIAPIRATSVSSEVVGPAAFNVFLDIETGPDRTYAADGSFIAEAPIASGRASVAVLRQELSWSILGIELEKDGAAAR